MLQAGRGTLPILFFLFLHVFLDVLISKVFPVFLFFLVVPEGHRRRSWHMHIYHTIP